jgi:hypothetical protein
MLTVAQEKAVELAFYLKGYDAAQARTRMISHQNSFHGLLGRDLARRFSAILEPRSGGTSVTLTLQPIVKSFGVRYPDHVQHSVQE